MRKRPRSPKPTLESDPVVREQTFTQFPAPPGDAAFAEGYRECISMYALHAPNKRQVGRILDQHCITLEDACIRNPTRKNYAAYEGYRQAMKDLWREKRIR